MHEPQRHRERDSALAGRIIGAWIEIHSALGAGLLESAYEECLCHELLINFNVPLLKNGVQRTAH